METLKHNILDDFSKEQNSISSEMCQIQRKKDIRVQKIHGIKSPFVTWKRLGGGGGLHCETSISLMEISLKG
jgi:hypothetical protein